MLGQARAPDFDEAYNVRLLSDSGSELDKKIGKMTGTRKRTFDVLVLFSINPKYIAEILANGSTEEPVLQLILFGELDLEQDFEEQLAGSGTLEIQLISGQVGR
jgi:hypothetical protein